MTTAMILYYVAVMLLAWAAACAASDPEVWREHRGTRAAQDLTGEPHQ